MARHSHDTGTFIAGVLIGSVVGASVALLCAPKPGRLLRDDLNESASSLRQAVTTRYESLARQAGLRLRDLESHAERAVRFVETSAHDLLETAKARTGGRARTSEGTTDAEVGRA